MNIRAVLTTHMHCVNTGTLINFAGNFLGQCPLWMPQTKKRSLDCRVRKRLAELQREHEHISEIARESVLIAHTPFQSVKS